MPTTISPLLALDQLRQGNQRFASGQTHTANHMAQIKETASAQQPKAMVLGCMDSRSAPETIFDQGIGELLSIRVAGHVLNEANIASMVYGHEALGVNLIVVLGHSNCGAVTAACQSHHDDDLKSVLAPIQPAVDTITKHQQLTACTQPEHIDAVAAQHVLNTVHEIPKRCPRLQQTDTKILHIVGAMYDVRTGKVDFLDATA